MKDKTTNIFEKASKSAPKRRREYKPRVNSKRYKQGYEAARQEVSDSSWWSGFACGVVTTILIPFAIRFFI